MLNHFSENFTAEQCNKGCDNCQGRTIESIDITSCAKSLIKIIEQLNNKDEKATLLQVTPIGSYV